MLCVLLNGFYFLFFVLRFVKFVSTPEVLERIVTIEREINQIESSNEQVNGPPGMTKMNCKLRFFFSFYDFRS